MHDASVADTESGPVHVWCVANPTGGGGKGGKLMEALTVLLRRRFLDLNVHRTPDDHAALTIPAAADDEMVQPMSSSSCNVYFTQCSGDGSRIAKEIVAPQVLERLGGPSLSAGQQCQRKHFVVIVGGDGTLSEVIDGLCRGLLEQDMNDTTHGMPTGCCALTNCAHRRSYAQRHLFRLPTIVYLAGGTGADFARLGYCCTTPEEVFSVVTSSRVEPLAGMSTPPVLDEQRQPVQISTRQPAAAAHDGAPPLTSLASQQTTKRGAKLKVPRTATYAKIDVGMVTFLNPVSRPLPSSDASIGISSSSSSHGATVTAREEGSGPMYEHRYFINEASVGLSSAVVQRAEKLKRSCLSCFGGGAVFLGASAIELLRMKPRPVRMRNVMDLDDPVNLHSPGCQNATALSQPSVASSHQPSPSSSAEEHAQQWSEGTWVSLDTTALVFGNGQFFGGGMKVCPDSHPFDQRLAITSWGESTCGYVFGFPSIYTGRASRSWKSSRMFSGQRVLVEPDLFSADERNSAVVDDESRRRMEEFALMEADGEPLSRLPALVELCINIRFAFLR